MLDHARQLFYDIPNPHKSSDENDNTRSDGLSEGLNDLSSQNDIQL